MFTFNDKDQVHLLIDQTVSTCPSTGVRHCVVTMRPRHPATYGVYVGHPISGIRVGRILDMQHAIRRFFDEANRNSVQRVVPYFPMRTTHLGTDEVGDNEYGDTESLFSDTRHFTLQNRQDALCQSHGVLIDFELRDDAGAYRVSKGIPFDYGWAHACRKPVVVAISRDNPNWTPELTRNACHVTADLAEGVQVLNALLPHAAARQDGWKMAVEVFDFTGAPIALDMISRLAEADMRKHTTGGRAIITVMPEGKANPNWHGQVKQVSDWIVPDLRQAEAVVRHLLGR